MQSVSQVGKPLVLYIQEFSKANKIVETILLKLFEQQTAIYVVVSRCTHIRRSKLLFFFVLVNS